MEGVGSAAIIRRSKCAHSICYRWDGKHARRGRKIRLWLTGRLHVRKGEKFVIGFGLELAYLNAHWTPLPDMTHAGYWMQHTRRESARAMAASDVLTRSQLFIGGL